MERSKQAVPTHIDLMWPMLDALKALGGSGTNEEILDKIIEMQNISEEIQNIPHTRKGRTKLEYRAAWARTYLKTAGAITNSDVGVWSITEQGEHLSQEEILKRIQDKRRDDRQKRKLKRAKTEVEPEELEDKEEDEEELDWKSQLLQILTKIHPSAFERLSQRILRESGFVKVEVTGKSGDGGIDGVGVLRLNLLSFQVFFQCKRYQGSVGSGAIRDFRGAMIGRCDKGLFITTGSFTSDARKEATRDGAPAIDLIDGEEVCELLKRLKLGVSTELIENVMLEPEWFEKI